MYLSSTGSFSRSDSSWSSGSYAQIVLPNGKVYAARIMATPAERARGMQFEAGFPPETVMLFVHPNPGRRSYHMRNVPIPLDISWVDSAGAITEQASAVPGTRLYGGRARSAFVIEASAGFASANNLKVGDRLQIR